MFTPPASPLPSPGQERDPMDAAGAALLGVNVVGPVNAEKAEKNIEETTETAELLEEWQQRQTKKKRKARLRTVTATVIIPVITLAFVFFKINPFYWSATPATPDTNVPCHADKDNDTLSPSHIDPGHHFNPHVPHSPLNHIPRRELERRASVSTASSLSSTGTALQTASVTGSGTTAQTTLPPVTGQAIPTVPSSSPTLPTPFPQPFDSDFGQNFSAQSCYDFFANMTNTQPFRSCRPFGMLVGGSDSFVKASESLETLNAVIWGTCNTNIAYADCIGNVNWFSTALQSSCAKELSENNARVVSVLGALESYPLYHRLGCLVDPASNTYCYLNAVHNSNPADVYLYGIGLGKPFPSRGKANPSCSACSRQVLGVYAAAVGNGTGNDKALLGDMALTNLQNTYSPAASSWSESCGNAFAQTSIAATNDAVSVRVLSARGLSGVVAVFVAVVLLGIS
ncbi:hypothetical protein V5O48_011237 [Marasmius crinis-equi]|uniref:DUF7729 domain-containing protein n=1 Tax=Marasmius crinis-equi TaxID=585013 RepID=A0ABR3F6K2_9AGAR